MFSFNKILLTLATIMMMLMVRETSARIVSSSSAGHQEPKNVARKLAECTANCGSCTNDNVEVTFLDFLDLTIFDWFWQGIVICLPLELAELADQINLGTCCAENDDSRIGVAPQEGEESLLQTEEEEGLN
jgi:bacterioferritin-associated ferredoxin